MQRLARHAEVCRTMRSSSTSPSCDARGTPNTVHRTHRSPRHRRRVFLKADTHDYKLSAAVFAIAPEQSAGGNRPVLEWSATRHGVWKAEMPGFGNRVSVTL